MKFQYLQKWVRDIDEIKVHQGYEIHTRKMSHGICERLKIVSAVQANDHAKMHMPLSGAF